MILATDITIDTDVETSKTYKLSNTGLRGSTDEMQALQQAILKVLNTERYECPIYSFNYGIETEDLIGKNPAFVQAELKRRIVECLLQDERITGVESFSFSVSGDRMQCNFDVISIFGTVNITREVRG
jgi:hypothetical protein